MNRLAKAGLVHVEPEPDPSVKSDRRHGNRGRPATLTDDARYSLLLDEDLDKPPSKPRRKRRRT